MKKTPSPPQRKQLKPVRNRVKTKPRSDPFQRALNIAIKKYEKAQDELAKARAKIKALEQELPGLDAVIRGLQQYFGDVVDNFDARRLMEEEFEALRRNVTFERTIDREKPEPKIDTPPRPKKAPGPPKPGTAALYVCNKCGGFTATADFPPLCSNEACMSRDLVLKEVKGPNLSNPNGGGAMVVDAGLPSAQVDDDPLPTDLPGKVILE